ncbi:hypothetical protein Tco_0063931 [Tanacetum coccineum]
MKEAISLVGCSRNLWQSFLEPPRQIQFEGIITSFIRDQEEELRQLEEYMNIVSDEFMQLSLVDIGESMGSLVIKALSSYTNSPLPNHMCVRYVHTVFSSPPHMRKRTFNIKPSAKTKPHVENQHGSGDSIVWQQTVKECLTLEDFHLEDSKGMSKRTRKGRSTKDEASSSQEPTNLVDKIQEFGMFDNSRHQGFYHTIMDLLILSEPVVDWAFFTQHGLAADFFKSINRVNFSRPQWVNLFQINEPIYRELVHEFFASFEFKDYTSRTKPEYKGISFRVEDDWKGYWPSIGVGEFIVEATIAKKIRDPKIRLAHRFLTTTISGRNSSTQRITAIDMFYLYCIYTEGVVCNIDIEPRAQTFTKKSLIAMDFIMELDRGKCFWPAVRGVGEDDEMKEEAEEPDGGIQRHESRGLIGTTMALDGSG